MVFSAGVQMQYIARLAPHLHCVSLFLALAPLSRVDGCGLEINKFAKSMSLPTMPSSPIGLAIYTFEHAKPVNSIHVKLPLILATVSIHQMSESLTLLNVVCTVIRSTAGIVLMTLSIRSTIESTTLI